MPFGLIGSVFNSIVGANNTRKTNDTNLKINQMNNEFNAREAEKAFRRESEYNDRIRLEDRAYNSASAQVQRYRDAGLNPSIMMQGQSAGIAHSNGVGSSAATASPSAPQQAFTPSVDGSGIGSLILNFLNYRKEKEFTDEQLNGLRIENQYKAQKILQDLADSRSRELSNKAIAALNKTIESLQPQILRNQTITAESQAMDARTNAMLRFSDTLLNLKQLQHFDEKLKADLALSAAHTLLLCAERGFTQQQTRKEVYNTIVSQYQAAQGKADYRLSTRLTDSIIDKWNWEVKLLERQFNLMPYDKGGSILNGLFNTATQGIIGYGLLRSMGKVPPIRGFGK